MPVNNSVLLIPQGIEKKRIITMINHHQTSEVYILRSEKDVSDELTNDINKRLVEIEDYISAKEQEPVFHFLRKFDTSTYKINFFKINEAIGQITKIVQDLEKDGKKVIVDLSSGPTTVCIALFIVAQILNLPISYCISPKYILDKFRKPLDFPPTPLEITNLTSQMKQILKILEKYEQVESISQLWRILETNQQTKLQYVPTNKGHEHMEAYLKKVPKKQLTRVSTLVDQLEKLGYVNIIKVNKEKNIEITDKGRERLKVLPL